jgi:hypothetical protein
MLTRQYKIDHALDFINSSKFGNDTYKTITLFNLNLHYALLSIKLNGIVQKRLDDGDIQSTLSGDDILKVKQTMTLDVIMKIEILIESTLILIDALCRGYKYVPQMMTKYHFNLIPKIIKNIQKKRYNLRKIMGLPRIDTLPVSQEEKKFLGILFSESSQSLHDTLIELIAFYKEFSILYGKSKHGLTFILGLKTSSNLKSEPNILNSDRRLIQISDRKKKSELPPGYIVSSPENQTFNFSNSYFNTISFVQYGKLLFDKIIRINSILKQAVSFICDNHLTFGANCGENYLPFERKERKVGVRMFGINWDHDTEVKLLEIFGKILPSMNVNDFDLTTVFEAKSPSPSIVESVNKNVVTNIWLSKKKNI